MKKMKIESHHVLRALSAKHQEDVFVAECKNGPTQTGAHARLDAWVMMKSWANPRTIGYEIKVSRSDFLQDQKWRSYLPMCNELYFCAPKGLIKQDELSAECGLVELVGESRLVTRKRAPYREIEHPEDLFRYILMCRTTIAGESVGISSRAERLKQWLLNQDEKSKLGYEVSQSVCKHVQRVERENERLAKQNSELADVKAFLTSINISSREIEYGGRWSVERRLKEIDSLIPPHMVKAIQDAKRYLDNVLHGIEQLNRRPANAPIANGVPPTSTAIGISD